MEVAAPVTGLCRHFDLLDMRCRFRNHFTVHPHTLDMKLNRLSHELARFFERRGRRDTAGKIGNMGAIASGGWFKENCVFAHSICLIASLTFILTVLCSE